VSASSERRVRYVSHGHRTVLRKPFQGVGPGIAALDRDEAAQRLRRQERVGALQGERAQRIGRVLLASLAEHAAARIAMSSTGRPSAQTSSRP
jgi:hypothetical protein